jgi:ribosomal protein L29
MKRKELSAIMAQESTELQKEARSIRTKLLSMRVARVTKPIKNVREMKTMRQRLAVILTTLQQKELNHG